MKYTRLQVDPLPVFEAPRIKKIYDFNILLAEYEEQNDKALKPVSRRKGVVPPADLVCPYCGAPYTYIYSNNGSKGQFWCKVCNSKLIIIRLQKIQILIARFVCQSCLLSKNSVSAAIHIKILTL